MKGIHAVFEGLAIGIEKDVSTCLGIAIAVVCHKWVIHITYNYNRQRV